MNPDYITTVLTSIVSAIIAVLTTWFALRRKMSRDRVEIVKDRAEENVIQVLTNERDKANEYRDKAVIERDRIITRLQTVDKEKSELYSTVQSLSSRVETLNTQITYMKSLMEEMAKKLDENQTQLKVYIAENAALTARLEISNSTVAHQHRRKSDTPA